MTILFIVKDSETIFIFSCHYHNIQLLIFQIPPTIQRRSGKHGAFTKERLSKASSGTPKRDTGVSPKRDTISDTKERDTKEWLSDMISVLNSPNKERLSKYSNVANSPKIDRIYHFIANMDICIEQKSLKTIIHFQYGCPVLLSLTNLLQSISYGYQSTITDLLRTCENI